MLQYSFADGLSTRWAASAVPRVRVDFRTSPRPCAGVKRRQRDWSGQQEDAADYDYLRDEVAYRLVDKLRVRKRVAWVASPV